MGSIWKYLQGGSWHHQHPQSPFCASVLVNLLNACRSGTCVQWKTAYTLITFESTFPPPHQLSAVENKNNMHVLKLDLTNVRPFGVVVTP